MVIVEWEGAVLGGESLGFSIVTDGIVCVRGNDAALHKLLGFFVIWFQLECPMLIALRAPSREYILRCALCLGFVYA